MPAIPVGLQGLMPERGLWGEVEIHAEDRDEAHKPLEPMLLRSGDAEIGVILDRVATAEGWEGTVGGGVGGLEVFQSVRKVEGKLQSRLDWRYTRGIGSALEQLLACEVMLYALRDEKVDLLWPDGDTDVEANIEPPEDGSDWAEELEGLQAFLGYVAELEAWVGQSIEPPAHPSRDDVETLGEVIARIREPEAPVTWQRVELDPGASDPDTDAPLQFALIRPLAVRIFDTQVDIGLEVLHLPEGRLSREGDMLVIVPVGAQGVGTARLLHPDEAPPEAARPLSG
jgi:hypothetical protein